LSAVVVLLDAGPWVALLNEKDRHHDWAKSQFAAHPGPFLTCEAVLAETCHLLARDKKDAGLALALIERGVVQIDFAIHAQIGAVRHLYSRYDNVPASLADACLIRMSEIHDKSSVLTIDSDFHVYRRHGRRAISVICP
jgi:uncharacterized protein